MNDPITVRVVGTTISEEVDGHAKARRRGLALSKAHPARWVDAKRPNGETVHRIEPRAYADEEPEPEPELPLPGQEPML